MNKEEIPHKTEIDIAFEMARAQSEEDYMKSGTFGASPFGMDGIPHARFGAISEIMVKYNRQMSALYISILDKMLNDDSPRYTDDEKIVIKQIIDNHINQ